MSELWVYGYIHIPPIQKYKTNNNLINKMYIIQYTYWLINFKKFFAIIINKQQEKKTNFVF